MSARAFKHLAITFEQGIDFVSKRCNLGREFPVKLRRFAGTDLRQRTAHAVQRTQAIAHLNEQRHENAKAQASQRYEHRAVKALNIGFHFGFVARHRKGHRHVIARQHHAALNHAQMLAVRSTCIKKTRAGNIARRVFALLQINRLIKQRARAQREAFGNRQSAIGAICQYQPE